MFVCVFGCFPPLSFHLHYSNTHPCVTSLSCLICALKKSPNSLCYVLSGYHLTFQLKVCIVCVFPRGEAILLPALPIPSISEREPKDTRPECPPFAFWQQPVPRHKESNTEPGGARSAGCQTHTDATTTTRVTHLDWGQSSQGQPKKIPKNERTGSWTQDSWWTFQTSPCHPSPFNELRHIFYNEGSSFSFFNLK